MDTEQSIPTRIGFNIRTSSKWVGKSVATAARTLPLTLDCRILQVASHKLVSISTRFLSWE